MTTEAIATFDAHGRAHGPDGRFLPTVGLDLERVVPEVVQQRRDPKAAMTHLQFVSPGLPQVDRWDSRQAIQRGYLANWVVARCAHLRAQAVATLPFRAGAQLPASPMDAGLPSPSSRLGTLLGPAPGGPAPNLSARRLIYWVVLQGILTGKRPMEIEWSGAPGDSEVAALWPLTAAALRAIPSSGTSIHPFDRFVYGRPDQPRRLSREEVFYGWDPAPDDYRQPYSVLESGSMPINVAVLIDRYQVAFLRNDARPSTVVVTQAFSDPDDAEAFQRDYEARHRGVDKAGSTAFIEAQPDSSGAADATKAVHIETVGLSQRDARMLETHKNALVEVAGVMGTPWSKIDASGRTFDNASQEDASWWRNTVLDDVTKLQEEINLTLAPLLGSEVGWFDLSQVEQLRPKPPVTAQEASVLVAGRIAAPEEVRPWFGLPAALPEGLVADEPVVEPVSPPEAQPEPEPERSQPPSPAPQDPRSSAADPAPPAASPAGRVAPDRSPSPHATRSRERDQERTHALAAAAEPEMREAMESLFQAQADSTVKRLNGTARSKRWAAAARVGEYEGGIRAGLNDLFNPEHWMQETAADARRILGPLVRNARDDMLARFGLAFDLVVPGVEDFIAARPNFLAREVTETTFLALQDALAEGVAAGEGIDDLTRRVREVFDVQISRAETIARTETLTATRAAQDAAAHALGSDVVAAREWVSAIDARTRASHVEANGQVVGMGQPFIVGGEMIQYPGDGSASNSVNCRCTVAYLTPQDMEGRSRMVPLPVVRALLGTVRFGEPDLFDEQSFRRSLLEVAA